MPESFQYTEQPEVSQETKEILQKLAGGGNLHYFYLSGGVALHKANGEPSGEFLDIGQFLDLREMGLIEKTNSLKTGYPYYAANEKSDVYSITEEGKMVLQEQ